MARGRLITFEGIDGSGKSTQMRMLADHLAVRGVEMIETREPGGTELGVQIRAAVLGGATGSVEPLAELLLYCADRAQHIRQLIAPALAAGKTVLSDRFYDATTAFQGYGRGFDLGLINQLTEVATGGLKPNLTLLYDLDAEAALRRTFARRTGKAPDRLDREPLEFHARVRQGYLELAAREPERFRVISASGSIEETFQLTRAAVRGWFE